MAENKNVWLISWNKDNWNWENYEKKCAETASGMPVAEEWACASLKPKYGDEVFIIKLGEKPRGIFGHGRVIKEAFEGEHYDKDKAAAGKKERYIGVSFDRILNYKEENILSQDELAVQCKSQHWSPQNSGIMIKPDAVPMLHAMWEKIAGSEKKEGTAVRYEKNMILYGPPGTGKTYNSVIYAVAICENKEIKDVKSESYTDVLSRYNEYKKSGRIAFTAFHQSYGYEEFIEGIKPKLSENSEGIGYVLEDGIFKKFCKNASAIKVQPGSLTGIKEDPRIWGMILEGTGKTSLKKECFSNGCIRLGWSEIDDKDVAGDYAGDETASWNAKHMVFDFINSMEIGDIVIIEKTLTQIDAVGVITGGYEYDPAGNARYPRKRTVSWICRDISENIVPYLGTGRKQMARFSLFSFDYLGMDAVSEIVKKNSASVISVQTENKPYVFIIDEINRGNISKIFGELITLIEDTKRAGAGEAMEAVLPYSGDTFSVPDNVYILGTMNTADRSIALMDTALRRRFTFIEMMPDPGVLESLGIGSIAAGEESLNVKGMLSVINERIEYLYDREHMIGHAFFTRLAKDPSLDCLAQIFEENVVPLLQEYFYEDYEKIQLVLGDNTKPDEYKFILDRPVKAADAFNGIPDIDLPEKHYTVQKSAFRKIQSYKLIGRGL